MDTNAVVNLSFLSHHEAAVKVAVNLPASTRSLKYFFPDCSVSSAPDFTITSKSSFAFASLLN